MSLPAFTHDANAILDYKVDWQLWLDGDRIKTVEWTLEPGLQKVSEMKTATDCTILLKFIGKCAGDNYTVGCRITTVLGRQDERSFTLKVRER